ncbi:hypothetical protein [Mesorhizobium sp.]|uniref:hypothetical protein n=1 Tax=Mesorhizobium sp. TaxID=1871066 RepID=UPI000FE93C40|nr:hypothetical protein [Mesorhizobium sp.]RWA61026.1 MAG: hypothetical protein EOQ27_20975 [Mesorhizobium sp.]
MPQRFVEAKAFGSGSLGNGGGGERPELARLEQYRPGVGLLHGISPSADAKLSAASPLLSTRRGLRGRLWRFAEKCANNSSL